MENLIRITYKKKLLAFIIKADFRGNEFEFFTPNNFPLQLAYMHKPGGYGINPHKHPRTARQVKSHQEVIFVRSGKVRVDFYDGKKHYIESRILQQGDIIFLALGGHGFEFMQYSEIIEVKQGPFLKKMQSIKFKAVTKSKIKLRK